MTQLTTYQIILSIFFSIVTIATIFGNALVLYAFVTRKKLLRSPTHYFLANLAVADLLVGLLVMPFLAPTTVTSSWYFGETYCTIWEYIHYSLCASSMLSMTGVCVERLIGIKWPFEHRIWLTKTRIRLSIVGIWIIAVVVTATPLTLMSNLVSDAPSSDLCLLNLRTDFMLFVSICIYWIPVTGLVLVYWKIYRNAINGPVLRHSGNSLRNTQGSDAVAKGNKSGSLDHEMAQAKIKEAKLAKKILLFVGIILLLYCPLFTMFLLRGIESPYFSIELFSITGWIRYCCSCLNPYLYSMAVPGFRVAFTQIFCKNKNTVQNLSQRSQNVTSISASNDAKPGHVIVPDVANVQINL